MGVLTDYFRAADEDAARALLAEREDGPLVPYPELPPVDGVMCKGVDSEVVLRALVAAVPGPPAALTAPTRLVWPDESDATALAEGPWVTEVGEATRDALASVQDADALDVARRWATAEELRGVPPEALRPVVADLAALARRAAAVGDRLYCWMCA